MHAWPAPDLPRLPGRGHPVRVHDTMSGQVTPTSPGPVARLYVCGITPYDATHLGHAATYVAFDLLVRAWRDAGHSVRYVQNVTDVDDPLLERAAETGADWAQLAGEQTQLFRDDMAWLRVLPPDHYVGAVEAIPLIVEYIDRLRATGAVYDLDGDLYFSVDADPRFGTLSKLDRSRMLPLFQENGGDPDRGGKKDPLDCVLWQRERTGEPGWASPFGRGRPGWHIECTAIALHHLGEAFDVQGGGSDLIFPHHEMSASHGHVAGAFPFARTYVHAGMVGLGGKKMSKSQGNLEFASRLRERGADPGALRLAMLSEHYRTDREWSPDKLVAAEARLAAWRSAVAAPAGPDAAPVLAGVRARLADDLDAPGALAVVDRWAERARLHHGGDPTAPALVRDVVDALLGVSLH